MLWLRYLGSTSLSAITCGLIQIKADLLWHLCSFTLEQNICLIVVEPGGQNLLVGKFCGACKLVYRTRTQNLRFVEPMPEQIGTITMHFSKVSETPQKNDEVHTLYNCTDANLFWHRCNEFHFKAPTDFIISK